MRRKDNPAAGPQKAEAPKVLTQALSQARSIIVYVGLFSFFINILVLVGPLYMMQVYDRVLSSGSVPTLVFLTVAAVGLIGISALLEFIRARILIRMGGRFDATLNRTVFSGLVSQALQSSRTKAQPIRDMDQVRGFLTGAGLFFFFDAPWTPVFMIVIFLLHPLLGILALSGAVLLFLLALGNEIFTRKPLTEAAGHSSRALGFAESALRNSEVIEALGMLPGLRQRWLVRHRKALALQAQASDRASILTAATKFIRPMLQVAMLGTGAYLALSQIITPGVMIAASIIMGRALAPVEGAISNWRSFVLARHAYHRVRDFLVAAGDLEEAMPLPPPKGEIRVEKLVAAPPGGRVPVLKGISFGLPAGETLGIIGPSAAGKSSLARLLVGVWAPAAGHVRLDGAEICEWNRERLGPYLGYLPQDVELFDGTVAENIARFGDADPEAVVTAAQKAGVHDMILRLSDGYDTPIGEAGAVLSGGQRQRIGLARALYGDPVLVVLDEPNSNLDAEGEEALRRAIDDLKARGASAVIIAHRPSVLSVVDKLLVLRDGTIEAFGPRDEVLPAVTRPGEAGKQVGPGKQVAGGKKPQALSAPRRKGAVAQEAKS